ncbi:MAG: agmatine deiminase family protein, partial [Nitrospinaceae bacterium]
MPAEWEPHTATWLTWPHNRETWPKQDMAQVKSAYVAMVRALSTGETVNILVNNDSEKERIAEKLLNAAITADSIELHIIPTDDSWIRDYGPNFLVRETPAGREAALNKWKFDSWGGKYEWEQDNRAGSEIAGLVECPRFDPGIVLEGGAVEVNGVGTCLTTESCLLNKNRNGGLGRDEMESYLKNYLGVRKIVWLNGSLEGDDTDGHIDNLARFVNPSTILCAYEENAKDRNFSGLKNNLELLESATDQDGNVFDVVRLPMPGYVGSKSERLPASYANFYIGNRAVLLPTFGHPNDTRAHELLQNFFPEREIIGIPSQVLVWGLGSVHCLTQQEPAIS